MSTLKLVASIWIGLSLVLASLHADAAIWYQKWRAKHQKEVELE